MQPRTKSSFILLLALALLSIAATAQAVGNGQVLLSTKQNVLKVGKETSVDIEIKNAPEIYGVDVQIVFDPKILEVVDGDAKQAGIQIEAGKFIDEKKSFFLAREVDNEKGAIRYALTLLNPAPAVQGDGQLAQITFRAKTNGDTIVSVEKGQFGTQAGETISPDLTGVQITVSDKEIPTPTPTATPTKTAGQADSSLILAGLAAAVLVVAVLAGVRLWRRKTGRP